MYAIMGLTTMRSLHMRVMATHASSLTSRLAPRCTRERECYNLSQNHASDTAHTQMHLQQMQQAPQPPLPNARRSLQPPHAQVCKRRSGSLLVVLALAPAKRDERLPPFLLHYVPDPKLSLCFRTGKCYGFPLWDASVHVLRVLIVACDCSCDGGRGARVCDSGAKAVLYETVAPVCVDAPAAIELTYRNHLHIKGVPT